MDLYALFEALERLHQPITRVITEGNEQEIRRK
jgi:hypothetical protein